MSQYYLSSINNIVNLFKMEDGINYAAYKRKCLKYGYDPKNIISLEVLSRSSNVRDSKNMYHERKKKEKKKQEEKKKCTDKSKGQLGLT